MSDAEQARLYREIDRLEGQVRQLTSIVDTQVMEITRLQRLVDRGEVLDHHPGNNDKRYWSACGTWLYPGDKVVVVRQP